MGRRSLEDRNIRKLQKTGRGGASYSLTLPKELVKELGWKERQKVTVEKKGETLIISDWKE